MMSQFIMDLKAEHNATTKLLNHYNGYNLSPNSNSNDYSNEQTTTNGVLDLSRRRDSVETRKTPSPYSPSTFSEGSPSTHHGSPSISTTTTVATTANGTKIHFPLKRSSPILLHHHHHPHQHHQQQQLNNLHNLQNIEQYHGTSPVSPVYPVFPGFPIQQFSHHAYHSDNDTTTGTTTAVAVAATTAAAAVLTANLYRSSPPIHSNNNEINHQFVLKTEDSNDAEQNNSELIKRLKDKKSDLSDADSDNESISVASTGESSGGGFNNNSNNSAKKYPMIVGRDGKLSRPFKAYPRDPMTLAASFTATDTLLDSNSAEKYNTFRKRMLEQIHAANGGTPTVSNPKMRRTTQQKFADDLIAEKSLNKFEKLTNAHSNNNNNNNNSNNNNLPSNNNNNNNTDDNNLLNDNNNTIKDSAYFERRKKNNAAAKKSRDRRRIKEDEIAIRAAFLERENIELKFELAAARKQLQIYGVSTTATTTAT